MEREVGNEEGQERLRERRIEGSHIFAAATSSHPLNTGLLSSGTAYGVSGPSRAIG